MHQMGWGGVGSVFPNTGLGGPVPLQLGPPSLGMGNGGYF